MDHEKNLVRVSCAPGLRTVTRELIDIRLPELPISLADDFVGYNDATCEQQFLDIVVTETEARVQSDSVAHILAGEAVVGG